MLFDEGQDLLFGIIDDRDRIIHKAVTSRNYMTHFSDHLANQAMVEDREMHVVTEELRLLLYVCLLRDLGFSDPEIPEFLRKSQSFIRTVNAVAANRESLDV